MSEYVLRWQYGLFNEDIKIRYTYGNIDTLRNKSNKLAENEKIVYITIDKVEEVVKDCRTDKLIEYMNITDKR